jgi:hypothetical protein
MKNNWVESRPEPNDTVRISWSDWMKRNDTVGVFLRYHSGYMIIDIGSGYVYIDSLSTVFVYNG